MVRYFAEAPPADAAWAVFFLTGRRLKRLVPGSGHRRLDARRHRPRRLAARRVLRRGRRRRRDGGARARSARRRTPSTTVPPGRVGRGAHPAAARRWRRRRSSARVIGWWRALDRCSASCCSSSSPASCASACRRRSSSARWRRRPALPATTIAARLMGEWTPTAEWYRRAAVARAHRRRPLASVSVLPGVAARRPVPIETLGAARRLAGRMEVGRHPRAAGAARRRRCYLWSRGEELITDRFPEIAAAADASARRHRARRRGAGVPRRAAAALLGAAAAHRPPEAGGARRRATVPVVFMAYDLLEETAATCATSRCRAARSLDDADGRGASSRQPARPAARAAGCCRSTTIRRVLRPAAVAARLAHARRRVAVAQARASRARGVEGLMLKRLIVAVRRRPQARRLVEVEDRSVHDRRRADLRAARQRASAPACSPTTRSASGTTASWCPIAKAYSGLSNEEIAELDRWIRRHTRERFGPVRHVEPVHVFELGFEAIARRARHRSGIAVRFPRMLRWRTDKTAREADTVETLRALLDQAPPEPASRRRR